MIRSACPDGLCALTDNRAESRAKGMKAHQLAKRQFSRSKLSEKFAAAVEDTLTAG